MISAFSQSTAAQIKFHHPFTLSDLVILKCCANTTFCQQPAPPPSPSGEKHITAIGLHPDIPLNLFISPPWSDVFKDAIVLNVAVQQGGDRDGWGWTKGLQKRLQESKMGLEPRPRQN